MPTIERDRKDFNPVQGIPGAACETLREAIHRTATCGTVPMKSLAADLDFSPSNLSQRTTLGADGIPFPADDRLVKIQKLTGDFSILLTMADALGFELVMKRERLPELVAGLGQRAEALIREVQQLKLSIPIEQLVGPKRRVEATR